MFREIKLHQTTEIYSVTEIRTSQKSELLKKVRDSDYGKYLQKVSIDNLRGFQGEDITFDFPVTALIGPNGSGKSSVLGAAGCAYKSIKPGSFFPKSAIGDDSMAGWKIEYELIDKKLNNRQTLRRTSNFRHARWVRGDLADRKVLFFGIERTVPAGEKAKYKKLTRSTYKHTGVLESLNAEVAKQVEHILGKSVSKFEVTEVDGKELFFVGASSGSKYSEFHFGAGESSILRMITEIEAAPKNTLILIEEIENGLHPVATQRIVEYLIDVASRKSLQTIFTTHSDYALSPLPSEAIWACINGKLKQGKLTVEALRAVSGRVERELAIFVEDEFAKFWVDCILREEMGSNYDQIEVHSVAGDGNAVSIHNSHRKNPSISSKSLCVLDGDSKQTENKDEGVLRLPGSQPELSVYESVANNLDANLAVLTVSMQRSPESQTDVKSAVESVLSTNRDPHLIFNQVGMKTGWTSEIVVRGAFLVIWARENSEYCKYLAGQVQHHLDQEKNDT